MTLFDQHLDDFRDAWLKQGHTPKRDDAGAYDWHSHVWNGRGCQECHGPICANCELTACCMCVPPDQIPRCEAMAEARN